jgi:hypothetical protein
MAAIANAVGEALSHGVIGIYTGSQPSSGDAAETGELLAWVTKDGGDFVSGELTNGLTFETSVDGSLSKSTSETWTGEFIADGTMGYFRFYANTVVTGESSNSNRVDGRIGTSRADMEVVTTTATIGGSVSPNSFTLNFSVIN